jgi:hypothetical protein
MPDLGFVIEGAETAKFAASPQIILKLRITNLDSSKTIQSIALRGQIQIEVTRRRYKPEDQEKLRDLFGEPERWSQTLKNLLWTHVSVNVPAFQNDTIADVPVPCTFDFNVGATKYFHGLTDGEVPLNVMFSGTVFYSEGSAPMQVAPISWDKEARFNLPVSVWRDMMDTYYPGTAWLSLRRDIFERLYDYKVRHGIPTWEQAFESMLEAEVAVRS